MMENPFKVVYESEASDVALVAAVKEGNRDALEELVKKHQGWIYNLSVRMVFDQGHAEEATQEILIKLVTKLDSFKGESELRTWLYRVAVNHLLNVKYSEIEPKGLTFSMYGEGLDSAPILDLPDEKSLPVTHQVLINESKLGCTMGMLLCLDRRQRMIFVLGEMLGASSKVGGAIMEITADHFRQLLKRSKDDLYQFMNEKCGLVNKANPCRCKLKTQAFIDRGYVDPENIKFAVSHLAEVKDVVGEFCETMEDDVKAGYADIYRSQPFYEAKEDVIGLKALFESPRVKRVMGI